MPVIGIDLGNTYSCMAVYQDGKPDVIHNHRSLRNTPNWIAFTPHDRLVGDDAKNVALLDAENVIYDVRRVIGRPYTKVAELAKQLQWPFEVIEVDENPHIRVTHRGRKQTYAPEQLLSIILRYLAECATDVLGEPVKNVVLTVPSTFDDTRRRAIRRAGELAGLNVMRLVREPTAAAIAFHHIGRRIRNKTVLVYDFGGGTFDITVLQVKKQLITKLVTARDAYLGGENLDSRLVEYFVHEIKEKYQKDIQSDECALRQLRVYCERLKVQLSTLQKAKLQVESDKLVPNQSITLSVSRALFEQLNQDLFERSFEVVTKALDDARMTPGNVDEILLVGGSTRIPKVREMVQNYFPGKPVNLSLNPGEAVACGAAIVAANLNRVEAMELPEMMLYEINLLALSIGQFGGIVDVFIPQNTPLPAGISKTFGTAYDNQSEVVVTVFEGNRVMQKDNRLLATVTLSGLRPAPWGEVKFKVTFKLDENKCLYICVAEMPDGVHEELVISRDAERSSRDYFVRMLEDAKKNESLDKAYRIRRDRWYRAYRAAVKATYKVQFAFKEKLIDKETYETMLSKCDETVAWFMANETADQQEFQPIIQELKSLCSPVL